MIESQDSSTGSRTRQGGRSERERRRVNASGRVQERNDGLYGGYVEVTDEVGEEKPQWVEGKNIQEVKAKLEQLQNSRSHFGSPVEANHITFKAYTFEYLRVKSQEVTKRTRQVYEQELRRLVFPYLGEMLLADIRPRHIRDMQIELAEDIGAASAQHARKHALSVLNMAEMDELIFRNPAAKVKPVRKEHVEVRIWTADEVRAFLAAARSHPYYAMFYLALMTGLRPGELCALEWDCVFHDRIYVKQTVTNEDNRPEIGAPKTRAGRRYVPLSPDAKAVLDSYAPAFRTGYVFPSESGTVLNFANVRYRWFVPLLEEAGLKPTKPYVMRHTFASMMIHKGVKAPTLARWMGHTDSGFTLRYYVKAFEQSDVLTSYTLDELLCTDAQRELALPAAQQNNSGFKLTLSPAQREALLRGEPLTLELGAG